MPAATKLNAALLRRSTVPVVDNVIDFSTLSNIKVALIDQIHTIYLTDTETGVSHTITGLSKSITNRLNTTGTSSTLKAFGTLSRGQYSVNKYIDKLLNDLKVNTADIAIELALTFDDLDAPATLTVTGKLTSNNEALAYDKLIPNYIEISYY